MAPLLLAASGSTFGLPEAVTYFVARRQGRGVLGRATLLLVLAGLMTTALIFYLAPILAARNEVLRDLIRLAAIAITPTLLVGVLRSYAGARGRWGLTTLESLATSCIRLGWIFALVLSSSLTVTSATIAMAATLFLGVVAYLPLLFSRDIPQGASGGIPGLLRYGSSVWIGSLSGIMLTYLDQALMTPLSNSRELGIYSVCVSVTAVVLVFNTTLRFVMFASDSEKPDLARLSLATRLSNAGTLVLALAIGVLSPWLVPLLFGPEFAGATPVLIILLFAIVVGNPGSLAGVGLGARGRPGLRSASLAVACLINAVLVVLLVPSYGAVGAAWATVAGNLVSAALNVLWLRLYFQAPISWSIVPRLSDSRVVFSLLRRVFGRGNEKGLVT